MKEISAFSVMDFLRVEMTTRMRAEQRMSFFWGLERLLTPLAAALSFGS